MRINGRLLSWSTRFELGCQETSQGDEQAQAPQTSASRTLEAPPRLSKFERRSRHDQRLDRLIVATTPTSRHEGTVRPALPVSTRIAATATATARSKSTSSRRLAIAWLPSGLPPTLPYRF